MSISRKVSRGVFWVGISTIVTQSLWMFTYMVLLRIVARPAFGIVNMAVLAIGALQLFQEFGLSVALVYRNDRIREAADTMFVLLFLLSASLYAVAFIGAPAISAFFIADPQDVASRHELINVLRVLSLTMVLGSLGQVPLTLLNKEMDFRKRLVPDIIPEVIKDITVIVLALKGFGAWSLVYAQTLDMALTSILAWVVAPIRPRPRLDMSIAREMIHYGKHIQASQILVFLITNIDNTFVGRLRGPDDLAVYGAAYTLTNTPATRITKVVGQVMFPAMSRVRGNLADRRRVFLNATKYVSLISVPMSVAIFVFAAPFEDIIYGAKWANMILPIQLLIIYGMLRSVAANMGDVFKAGGKPQWLVGIASWRLAMMAIFLYPVTTRFGIVGVSALSAIVSVADFLISTFLVNRVIKTSFGDFARLLGPIFGLSLVAALAGELVFRLTYGIYPPLALMLGGGCMVVVYVLLTLRLDSEVRRRMIGLLNEIPVGIRVLRACGIQAPVVAPVEEV